MKKLFTLLFLLCATVLTAAPAVETDPAAEEMIKLRQEAEERTFKQVKGEVKAGFDDSLVDLAELYYQGVGTKQNYKKAYKYYQKAAQKTGSDYAAYSQAFMLMYGQGVKKAPLQAFDMLLQLAQDGYPPAALEIYRAYKKGSGCQQDDALARQWLEKAANYRLPSALLYLGIEKGEEDPQESFSLLKQAADLESERAQYLTALGYQTGTGTEPNARRAFDYMLRAAKQRYAPAQWQTAQWYEQGYGTQADLYQAFRWTRLAAQQGVAAAQERLANMYERGQGIPANAKLARKWQKEAQKTKKQDAKKAQEKESAR